MHARRKYHSYVSSIESREARKNAGVGDNFLGSGEADLMRAGDIVLPREAVWDSCREVIVARVRGASASDGAGGSGMAI